MQKKPDKTWVPLTDKDISNYLHIQIMFGIHKLPKSSSCARSVADIGDHGLPILSVVSSPDELIVGRFCSCYKVIQTVCVVFTLSEYKMYWSKDHLLNFKRVSDAMSRSRFESIHRYFHLNDAAQGDHDSENYDPMLKVGPILDQVRGACLNVFAPQCELSIDEGTIGFRGRKRFRQYLPSKLQGYGLMFSCCTESKNCYVLNLRFYTGKK